MVKKKRTIVNRFLDIEVAVGESDEDEEEEVEEGVDEGVDEDEDEIEGGDGMELARIFMLSLLIQQFIEAETIDTRHTPWKDVVENEDGGWGHFVAALEDRYSGDANTRRSVERLLANDPVIAASVDKISRSPTMDDYPLWRLQCKVYRKLLYHVPISNFDS